MLMEFLILVRLFSVDFWFWEIFESIFYFTKARSWWMFHFKCRQSWQDNIMASESKSILEEIFSKPLNLLLTTLLIEYFCNKKIAICCNAPARVNLFVSVNYQFNIQLCNKARSISRKSSIGLLLEKFPMQCLQFNWIMLFILHRHGGAAISSLHPLASSCATPCYSQVLFMFKQQ